jgi:hypothetical protein
MAGRVNKAGCVFEEIISEFCEIAKGKDLSYIAHGCFLADLYR